MRVHLLGQCTFTIFQKMSASMLIYKMFIEVNQFYFSFVIIIKLFYFIRGTTKKDQNVISTVSAIRGLSLSLNIHKNPYQPTADLRYFTIVLHCNSPLIWSFSTGDVTATLLRPLLQVRNRLLVPSLIFLNTIMLDNPPVLFAGFSVVRSVR